MRRTLTMRLFFFISLMICTTYVKSQTCNPPSFYCQLPKPEYSLRIKSYFSGKDPRTDTNAKVKWYQTNAFKITAVPAILIGYGVSVMDGNGLFLTSKDIYNWREKNYPDFHTNIDNYMPSIPLVAMYALDVAGVESTNHWVHQTAIFVIANALNGLITQRLKIYSHVQRPDNSGYSSFPSAHTSAAFVSAEMLHQEFKHKSIWISVAGYTYASSVGVLRILNNKHWLSDVFVSAGVGILSVKLVYLVYPLLINLAFKHKVRSPYYK